MITFFLVLFVKNKITNYSDYKKIRGNKRIALGSWLRLPTSTGSIDVKITSIGMDRVLLENDETVINIPVSSFASMNKAILKKSPDTSNADELEG